MLLDLEAFDPFNEPPSQSVDATKTVVHLLNTTEGLPYGRAFSRKKDHPKSPEKNMIICKSCPIICPVDSHPMSLSFPNVDKTKSSSCTFRLFNLGHNVSLQSDRP